MIDKPIGRALTREDFTVIQELTGMQLAEDIVQLLIMNNGGKPSRTRFSTQDGKVESHFSMLLPLDNGADDTILEEIDGFTLAGWLPSNIISIGKTPADNRVVVSCDGPDKGCVLLLGVG